MGEHSLRLAGEVADGVRLHGFCTRRYIEEILNPVGVEHLAGELPAAGAAALFCVERDPEACHRSLIAERLAAEHGVRVSHVRP